jgi:uncharacterized protein YoxC
MPTTPSEYDRRDADVNRRNEDHIEALLESLRDSQSKGMEQLSSQISGVQVEVRELVAKSNEIALDNVRQITRLEGQVSAAQAAAARVEAEARAGVARVEAEAKERDSKMAARLDPIEKQFWKTAGMAMVVSGFIGIVLEAMDLFGRHAK